MSQNSNHDSGKRKRNILALSEKIKVLDCLTDGEPYDSVSKKFKINESTVRTIKKSEESNRGSMLCGTNVSNKVTSISRSNTMELMEKALSAWIDDQTQKGEQVSTRMIQGKAMFLYSQLKPEEETLNFQASKGWLERFKKRFPLQHFKTVGESASNKLKQFIRRVGYRPEQVFNACEAGLFWKKTPVRFEHDKPATAKDRLTLLLCCNASGNHMVKPMLVYKHFNPSSLRNKDKNAIPVYWRANPIGWVTEELFKDWLINCFVPSVEQFLALKSLPFKVLLILDSNAAHPESLTSIYPNVELKFLPPNTRMQLQPLDQGIVAEFRRHYLRLFCNHIIRSMDRDQTQTLAQIVTKFNMAQCIALIKQAVCEVRQTTINACWRKLWPGVVNESSCIPTKEDEIEEILKVLHGIPGEGFENLLPCDVEEVLNSHDEELTEYEVLGLLEDQPDKEEEESQGEEPKSLCLYNINNILSYAQELQDLVFDTDPSLDRSLRFKNGLENLLHVYREMQKDLKNK